MGDVAKLKRTFDALKSDRATLDGTWDDIERYVLPLTGKVQTSGQERDMKTDWETWDFTAALANEHLAAALAGAVTPSSARWFALEFDDPELRKNQDALAYLEQLTEMTWTELRNSDFAMEIGAGYLEYTGLGNMALVVEPTSEKKWDGLDFTCVPVRQVYFVEDSKGEVEQFFRCLKWSPLQIVDRFDDEDLQPPLPARITEAVAAGGARAIEQMDVVFAIWCREELEAREPKDEKGKFLPIAPALREYGFCYFLADTGEQLGAEGGYYEMPSVVGRWAKRPGTQWGFGRGNLALRTVKYLCAYLEAARAAAEKVVDPSTFTTERGLLSDLNLKAGGLTVARSKDDVWAYESAARFDVSAEVINDLRMEIRRLFHEDDLQLKESPAMTATEVQQRRDLMDRSLGSPVGRLQNDVLSPIIKIVLGHLERAGKLPPPPEVVKQKKAEVAVAYYGAISRAQRVDEVASIERLAAFTASLVKSDPERFGAAADVFDPVQAVREAALRLGTPAKVLKSEEQVQKELQARQQAQAAAQQAEVAKMQASALKDAATGMAALPQGPGGPSGPGGLSIAPQPALLPSTGFPSGY